MFDNSPQSPVVALDTLGALRIEQKFLGLVDLRVPSMEEGTTDLKEVISKVMLYLVTWRCVAKVVGSGGPNHAVSLSIPSYDSLCSSRFIQTL